MLFYRATKINGRSTAATDPNPAQLLPLSWCLSNAPCNFYQWIVAMMAKCGFDNLQSFHIVDHFEKYYDSFRRLKIIEPSSRVASKKGILQENGYVLSKRSDIVPLKFSVFLHIDLQDHGYHIEKLGIKLQYSSECLCEAQTPIPIQTKASINTPVPNPSMWPWIFANRGTRQSSSTGPTGQPERY